VADRNTGSVDDPAGEFLATTGLITMLGAVFAAVIAVVELSGGNLAISVGLGALAVFSFAASLVCFAVDSNQADGAPLPFPSWLRADPEPAAELSAFG
jgi:hypothetical protein